MIEYFVLNAQSIKLGTGVNKIRENKQAVNIGFVRIDHSKMKTPVSKSGMSVFLKKRKDRNAHTLI